VIRTFLIYSIINTSLSASLIAQHAEDSESAEVVKEQGSILPALKVLPAGSILSGVRIPRYNKDYTAASLLEAQQLKIINKRHIRGTSVDLKIYDADGKIKASTHLDAIDYDQATELISSDEIFVFSAAQFKTTSQGLILDWKNSRGFFLGKNHTIVYLKKSAPMKDNKNTANNIPTKALSALAAATMATTTSALSATTPAEIAELNRLSEPSTTKIEQINTQVALQVETANKASSEINKNKAELETRIKQSDKKNQTEKSPETPLQIPPELKPEKGKDHFSIKSEGNIFFDAKQGMMVFSKNVKLTHPEYRFSCDGEVKLILAKKIQDKKLSKKQIETLKPNEKFGDIKQIIATDNVSIVGRDKAGNPVAARAGVLVYDHSTGSIILRGLNSRITMVDKQLKIVEKNGIIKIDRNWNVSGKGTQIDLNVEKLKNNSR